MASTLVLSKEFREWLDAFAPDVIYAQATSRAAIAFCLAVQEYLDRPMVYHVMDDWPSLIGHKGLFRRYWYRRIDRELRELLDRTEVHLSISSYMSKAYKERYDKDFLPFHNPTDLSLWKQYQRDHYGLDDSPVILYAGRTGLGIDYSLQSIAEAVDMVNRQLRSSVRFVVQTGHKPEWMEHYSCAEYREFVPYEYLPKVFAEADFLILPYDFSATALHFIKYSMPTKASEYMICGTPIIIFAPEETALVQYAMEFDWAAVVTEPSSSALSKTIKQLLLEEGRRRELAKKAKDLAEAKHDSRLIRKEFRTLLSGLVCHEETAGYGDSVR